MLLSIISLTMNSIFLLNAPNLNFKLLALIHDLKGLLEFVQNILEPHPIQYIMSCFLINKELNISYIIDNFLYHTEMNYMYIVFTVGFFNLLCQKNSKFVYVIFILLAIFTLLILQLYPIIHIDLRVIWTWTVIYDMGGIVLLIFSYINENSQIKKQNKLIICIMSILFFAPTAFAIYLAQTFYVKSIFRYYSIVFSLLLIVFIVLSSLYGFLKYNIKFKKYHFNRSNKLLSRGISILNHTLKSEIMKIHICTENIKLHNECFDEYTNDNLQVILNSTKHMLDMTRKIHENFREIILDKKLVSINVLLNESIKMSAPFICDKNILINKYFLSENESLQFYVDPVYTKEMFINILKNAIEAIKDTGEINIYVEVKEGNIIILVKDNGLGVSKEDLPHVLEPFFSTKNNSQNYGLGLSFCYDVMRKHEGLLEISSNIYEGTSVYLKFPYYNNTKSRSIMSKFSDIFMCIDKIKLLELCTKL